MIILTLQGSTELEYLKFIFKRHFADGGVNPDELSVAANVWANLMSAQELDPTQLETADKRETQQVIKIPGPVSYTHDGDLDLRAGSD